MLTVPGISTDRMIQIRKLLINGPKGASALAVRIAKTIWRFDYLSKYLIGPKKRAARNGERCEMLPKEEEEKLQGISCMIF